MWTKLEIEYDEDDCPACAQRHADTFRLMQEVKIVLLGESWCSDCGAQYEVVAEAA